MSDGIKDLEALLDELPDDPEELEEIGDNDRRISRHGHLVVCHPYAGEGGSQWLERLFSSGLETSS